MNPMYFYIHALYKYLLDNLPELSEILFLEAIPQSDLQRFVLIADLGGPYEDAQRHEFDPELLIVAQDSNPEDAKLFALQVFETVKQLHDLTLPVQYSKGKIEIDSKLNFAKITAGTTPAPLGNTGNGLFQYVATLKISVCTDSE